MGTQKRQASIVGSSFYPGAPNWIAKLQPGQRLRVEREPANKYDTNACAVWVFQQKLGHLPRGLAAELAPFIDAGNVVTVHKSRDPRFGTSGVVVVTWDKPDEAPEEPASNGAKPPD
jgi:hypothetical protein